MRYGLKFYILYLESQLYNDSFILNFKKKKTHQMMGFFIRSP